MTSDCRDWLASNRAACTMGWRVLDALAVLLTLTLATGCATSPGKPAEPERPRPAWIDRPGDGVSASAGMHVQGERAQEELAVSRAREEFAKRYGVSISSEHDILQTATAGRSVTTAEKLTHESMKDNQVRAVIREKWLDPKTGVLWVWVVPLP